MRAIIYARVSSDTQRAENASIGIQAERCRDYVASRGYELVDVGRYVDPVTGQDAPEGIPVYADDYTGTVGGDDDERPALKELFAYLREYGADVVVALRLDRVARDLVVFRQIEGILEASGTRLELVELPSGEDEEVTKVSRGMFGLMSEWENSVRTKRSKEGKLKKAVNGTFAAGYVPFGYRRAKEAPGMAPDERTSEVVRRIFQEYVNGRSLRGIVDLLNSESIKAPKGGKWARSTVGKIVRNRTYVGTAHYGKHKRRGKKLRAVDASEWIGIPVAPLVDEPTFDEAQRKLNEAREVIRRAPVHNYLLGGLVRCRRCGKPYVAATAKAGSNRRAVDGSYYRHRSKDGGCTNHQVSARRLDAAVWNDVTEAIDHPDVIRAAFRKAIVEAKERQAGKQDLLDATSRAVVKVEQRIGSLLDLYLDGTLPKAEYTAKRKQLEAEKASLDEALLEAQREIGDVPTEADLEAVEDWARRLREHLRQGLYQESPGAEFAFAREVLRLMRIKVLVENTPEAVLFECTGVVSSMGVSSIPSARCVLQRPPLPAPA